MPIRTVFAAVLAAAALLPASPPVASAHETPVVFAAASLKNALDAVNAAWEAENGAQVVISYAGSPALARQIEEGAPADVFISADLDWMRYLAERDLVVPDSEVQLLGNRIVLVAPADSDATVTIEQDFDLAGLLSHERLAMAHVEAVPAGRYGKAALEALGVWRSVADRIAQAENVRAALALVSLGESPFGIVYRSDAAAEPRVRIVDTFPQDTHPPIVYPAALTAQAANPAAADFLAFLQSRTARSLFVQHGFSVLTPVPVD